MSNLIEELARLIAEVPKLFGPEAAADRLDVSVRRIHEMWSAGELGYVRVGRGRKVSAAELARWIAANERYIEP